MKTLALLGAMLLTFPMYVGVMSNNSDTLIQYVTGRRRNSR